MRHHYCDNSACNGHLTRDDYDCPWCKVCGGIYCSETCRDEHIEEQHPGWLADKQAEEQLRWGF